MENFTIVAPIGTTNHSDPQLFCTPADWSYIVEFLIANYLAHAATVLTPPAATLEESIVIVLMALFLPAIGAFRGLRAIREHPFMEKSPIKGACKAGALCMVVRRVDGHRGNNPKVSLGDVEAQTSVENRSGSANETLGIQAREASSMSIQEAKAVADITARQIDSTADTGNTQKQKAASELVQWDGDLIYADKKWKVHGLCSLIPEYTLAIVPKDAAVAFRGIPHNISAAEKKRVLKESQISNALDVSKILIAIAQILFGVITLYRARGDQLQEYGYFAFGLTVLPYAWMSLINLLGNLATPSYPCLYMIWTPEMDAAIAAGALIDGVVGTLDVGACAHEPVQVGYMTDLGKADWIATFVCGTLPLAAIQLYWRFNGRDLARNIPVARQAWITAWYVVSFSVSLWSYSLLFSDAGSTGRRRVPTRRRYIWIAVSGAIAIGAAVQVVYMLKDFGNCITLG
ncbi:hypothetical protein V8E51_016717 [Hyaloscypha variabilis]